MVRGSSTSLRRLRFPDPALVPPCLISTAVAGTKSGTGAPTSWHLAAAIALSGSAAITSTVTGPWLNWNVTACFFIVSLSFKFLLKVVFYGAAFKACTNMIAPGFPADQNTKEKSEHQYGGLVWCHDLAPFLRSCLLAYTFANRAAVGLICSSKPG